MRAMTVDRTARSFELPALDQLQVPSRWMWGGLIAALTLGVATLVVQWRDPDLSRLRIEGQFERVSPEVLRQAVLPALDRGFFETDVEAVRDQLTQLPWVARARVERSWPAGLRIRVWEREAYARWNDGALLDTEGAAFEPATADRPEALMNTLPQLGGTPGNEVLVAQSYRRLSAALEDTPLAISGLQLDPRGEWTATTRLGLVLRLGAGDIGEKLPTLTGALLDAVGGRLDEVAYVDLRYTNGFAIGWVNQDGTQQGRAPVPNGAERKGALHG